MQTTNRIEAVASIAVVVLVILGCLLVLRPFVSAILWAGVLCYGTWPIFLRLNRFFRRRRTLTAAVMTLLISIVLVAPFVLVGVTLASNVSRMEDWFRYLQNNLPHEAPAWVGGLPVLGPAIENSWTQIVLDTERTSGLIKDAVLEAGKWGLRHGLDFGKGIAQMVVSMLVAFAFFREGERLIARILVGGHRIAGESVQRHLTLVGRTIRSVVYGVLGTGLAQGIMAGLGFWIASVPSPFLLGLITFMVSFIPAGPPFIWVPAAIWLFAGGHTGWAIFMAIWGLIAISGIDNVVKPYLIMYGSNLPFVTILLGVIGGVIAFGFIGLFLGPVLLAVGHALIREFTASRQASPPPSPPG
ncbi:MAG: AI-2E family transporter [Lentisphaerae bacterium]|nr:AI-2E family transporter [Lentisphaerota bacterium]